MELNTSVISECEEEGLSLVSFYDSEKEYGFSLSRDAESECTELMVADQSCYHPAEMELVLSRNILKVTLPAGTIDQEDGGDSFMIHFQADQQTQVDLVRALKVIFKGKKGLEIKG